MFRAPRIRVNLRTFLLLCIAASFLIAWAGLKHQRADIESRFRGSNCVWKPFGNSSEIFVNSSGEVYGGSLQTAEDLVGLHAAPNLDCSELQHLGIYSSEALSVFQACEWPNLRKVWLANCRLTERSLLEVRELPKLQILWITETETDPSDVISDLSEIPSLRHLVLDLGPRVTLDSLDSFPHLEELQTLRLSLPDLRPDQLALLRQRLPHCVVTAEE
jgi:hypothetical protein